MFRSTKLRNYFVAGVLVIAPTAVSVYFLYRGFVWVDNLLGGIMQDLTVGGHRVPGIGFVTVIAIILVVGFVTSGYLGNRILLIWERLLSTIPLMNRLYPAIKQLGSAFLTDRRGVFRETVLIEYPRRGMYSIAFATKPPPLAVEDLVEQPLMSVFLPTTPNPTSGFFLMVPRSELIPVKLSVEEAIKLIVSGGMVQPGEVATMGTGRGGRALEGDGRRSGRPQAPGPGGDRPAGRRRRRGGRGRGRPPRDGRESGTGSDERRPLGQRGTGGGRRGDGDAGGDSRNAWRGGRPARR